MARSKPILLVFVAGFDYGMHGNDWAKSCLARERALLRTKRDSPVISLLFDIPSGTLFVRKFANPRALPKVTQRTEGTKVTKANYVLMDDEYALFSGARTMINAPKIYRLMLEFSKAEGALIEEFSIYSHAWPDGPILGNTWAFERPVRVGTEYQLARVAGHGTQTRDPEDVDPRPIDFQRDVLLSGDELRRWSELFSPQGSSFIWGCSESWAVKSLIRAVTRGRPLITASTKDDVKVLTSLKRHEIEQIASLNSTLAELQRQSGKYAIEVGRFRRYIRERLKGTYAQALANATRRRVFSAAPGTAAMPAPDQLGLMIDRNSADIVLVYERLFGLRQDPERLGYFTFDPTD